MITRSNRLSRKESRRNEMMHANKQNHAGRRLGLVLALLGLPSAPLMKGPIQFASAQKVAGSWSYTGSLNMTYADHRATLLPNDKGLVAGAIGNCTGGCSYTNGAELYDPAT